MAEIQPTDTPTADPIADAISFLENAADIPVEAEAAPEPTDQGIGTSPSEPTGEAAVKADEAIKAPEPVKVEEKLTPQMEALAKRDRALQEKQAAIKAAEKEYEAKVAKLSEREQQLADVELLAKTDLVSLAERVKLDPQARMKLAIELWESAQPTEKQTQQYREQAQARTKMTATEERLAKLEAETKAAQERARQAEEQAQTVQLGETIVTTVGASIATLAEKAPYTAVMLETDRAGVREDLLALAQQHWETDPDTELTAAMLIERYEPLLAAKFQPVMRVMELVNRRTTKSQSPSEAEKKPSTTLSAQRTAAPTKARPEPKSEEDLIRDAAAFLESRQ